MNNNEIKESNVYRINFDEDSIYIDFAHVDEFKEGLRNEDVEDVKTIKIKKDLLMCCIVALSKAVEEFDQNT